MQIGAFKTFLFKPCKVVHVHAYLNREEAHTDANMQVKHTGVAAFSLKVPAQETPVCPLQTSTRNERAGLAQRLPLCAHPGNAVSGLVQMCAGGMRPSSLAFDAAVLQASQCLGWEYSR